ncbi:hypothetical protein [Apibacter mensalis]|nr:hypothetical protein [Apibacter mensalis]
MAIPSDNPLATNIKVFHGSFLISSAVIIPNIGRKIIGIPEVSALGI